METGRARLEKRKGLGAGAGGSGVWVLALPLSAEGPISPPEQVAHHNNNTCPGSTMAIREECVRGLRIAGGPVELRQGNVTPQGAARGCG